MWLFKVMSFLLAIPIGTFLCLSIPLTSQTLCIKHKEMLLMPKVMTGTSPPVD